MHRFTQKFLPESFDEVWVRNAIRNIGENEIQLRNADQFQIIGTTLASLDLLPLYDFPKIWQIFPDEQLKFTRKTSVFDSKLKKYFIDDLSEIVVCNRRVSCPLLRSFYNKLLSSVLQLSRRVYVPLKLAASHVTVSRKMPRCLMPTYTAGSY